MTNEGVMINCSWQKKIKIADIIAYYSKMSMTEIFSLSIIMMTIFYKQTIRH